MPKDSIQNLADLVVEQWSPHLLRNSILHSQKIMSALGGGTSPVRTELHHENLENWKFLSSIASHWPFPLEVA